MTPNINFGFWSSAYNEKVATLKMIEQVREFHPDHPFHLVSDNGEDFSKIAKKFNISPTHLALAFVNTRPFVVSNIIGATTLKQLRENIESINIKLSDDIVEEVDKIHELMPNPAP